MQTLSERTRRDKPRGFKVDRLRYLNVLARLEGRSAAERAGWLRRLLPPGHLVRDHAAGRRRIARELARLEERNA